MHQPLMKRIFDTKVRFFLVMYGLTIGKKNRTFLTANWWNKASGAALGVIFSRFI